MSPVRILAIAAALVACAWFATGIRQAHDSDAANAIISSPGSLTAAEAAHATALLNAAGQLNPDTAVDLLRSQLALRQGDVARARQLALSVLRREPMNARAWIALGRAAAGNKAILLLAFGRLYRLAPPIPARR